MFIDDLDNRSAFEERHGLSVREMVFAVCREAREGMSVLMEGVSNE
jgi:hypothetical protein